MGPKGLGLPTLLNGLRVGSGRAEGRFCVFLIVGGRRQPRMRLSADRPVHFWTSPRQIPGGARTAPLLATP